jgi:hypothetical protein
LVPRLDPWLKFFIAANAAFFFLLIVWFQEVNPYFVVLSLVTALLIWVTAVVCAAKGQRSAYYFVAAFSVLLLANVATHLRNLGLLPTNCWKAGYRSAPHNCKPTWRHCACATTP